MQTQCDMCQSPYFKRIDKYKIDPKDVWQFIEYECMNCQNKLVIAQEGINETKKPKNP